MSLPLRSSNWQRPTLESQVATAKRFMRSGASMAEAARAIGVLPSELDAALWEYIGVAPDDLAVGPSVRPEPMF